MNTHSTEFSVLVKEIVNTRRNTPYGGSGFILGCPGSGKTMIAQQQIQSILQNSKDSVIIIDTDGTFSPWVEEMKGQVLTLEPKKSPYINPFDITIDRCNENIAIAEKSDFLIAWIEALVGMPYGLSAIQKSIIDSATRKVYEPYLESKDNQGGFDEGLLPTLRDFYRILLNQVGYDAYLIAKVISSFVGGSISVFSNATDLTHNNRLVVYNIANLGHSLGAVGSLAVLEHIWTNNILKNKKCGEYVWVFLDDAYHLMRAENTANYLSTLYKRARVRGCIFTAITQNLSYVLEENNPVRNTLINSDQNGGASPLL